MIYDDCHYDAGSSRELVNMKTHVRIDEVCLSYTCSDVFYSVSQSATYSYHIINTGTSCYNFSLRKKKRSVYVVTAMFLFSFEISSDILGVTLAPRRKQQRLNISYISVLILRVCFIVLYIYL